ncbi:uncharacterized protein HKW66_Vig0088330 [Vigna angularis]|uniref:Uncharacterized protein n=1 Tax=Phaseolus angularis TaxID=3914 RepID=A0A8T0KGB5_PHAAN|nr:uncharacterized protein HKW66_Vig0088330 [Vigna angularis]
MRECWWVNYRCMCVWKRLKHEVKCGTLCPWKRDAEAGHVSSWSTSTNERDEHENNECLEGLVDVSVQCDVDGDIDGNVEVEVEVESLQDNDDLYLKHDYNSDHSQRVGNERSNRCLIEVYSCTDVRDDAVI